MYPRFFSKSIVVVVQINPPLDQIARFFYTRSETIPTKAKPLRASAAMGYMREVRGIRTCIGLSNLN